VHILLLLDGGGQASAQLRQLLLRDLRGTRRLLNGEVQIGIDLRRSSPCAASNFSDSYSVRRVATRDLSLTFSSQNFQSMASTLGATPNISLFIELNLVSISFMRLMN